MISKTNTKILAPLFTATALGVGLVVILAGSPRAFAQSTAGRPDRTNDKIETRIDQKRSPEKALEQFAVTLEELYRIAADIETTASDDAGKQAFSLNYFVSMKPNGAARFSAGPTSRGENAAWSGNYREPLMRLYDAFLPRTHEWNDELFVQFEVGPNAVSLKATFVMDPTSTDFLSSFDQSFLKQKTSQSDFVRSQIYGASQVSVQKNKLIVVANLPRAGLESLLSKNDK